MASKEKLFFQPGPRALRKTKLRRKKSLLALSLLLMLALVLAACGPQAPQESPTQTTAQPAETVRQVRTITAKSGSLNATRSTSVTIEPGQESRVAAGTNGRVQRIIKREGQNILVGEAVILLDDSNLQIQVRNAQLALEAARINLQKAERASGESVAQLKAQIKLAQTNLELAQQQYREGQALYEAGGIAATQLTGLEAQFSQAQSALLQTQDALARSQRAGEEDLALLRVQTQQAENQLAQARDALAETRIAAPFAGDIAEIYVEEGEFVGAGSPAFRLVSNQRQLASFDVPPEDAAALRALDNFYIRYGGLDYAAFITRSSSVPGPQRLINLTAEIYPSQNPIPAGTVAQLNYEIKLGSGIILPSQAVSTEGGQNYVYVVESGRAKRQRIDILAEAGGEVVIEGLSEGLLVIYPRPLDVREGSSVRVIGP